MAINYKAIITLLLIFFAGDLLAQTAPSSYTRKGIRKWSAGANPGADSLNANWNLIDDLVSYGSERPVFTGTTQGADTLSAAPTWTAMHRDVGSTWKKVAQGYFVKRQYDSLAYASFQWEAFTGGVGDSVAIRLEVGGIYIATASDVDGVKALTEQTLEHPISTLTNGSRYNMALWLYSKGDTIRVQNLYMGVRKW